jgi:DNA-binding winged helix-turn-helix (wHTH) protein
MRMYDVVDSRVERQNPSMASRGCVRFGLFEIDIGTGELRKSGVRIKLEQQPLAVLLLLLDRPGEVVTREEIRARLWPAGVHVDFDRSLNKAIVKLRGSSGVASLH